MKLILSILCSFGVVAGAAQAPYLINYQGIARNSVGNVLPNKNITLTDFFGGKEPAIGCHCQ